MRQTSRFDPVPLLLYLNKTALEPEGAIPFTCSFVRKMHMLFVENRVRLICPDEGASRHSSVTEVLKVYAVYVQ